MLKTIPVQRTRELANGDVSPVLVGRSDSRLRYHAQAMCLLLDCFDRSKSNLSPEGIKWKPLTSAHRCVYVYSACRRMYTRTLHSCSQACSIDGTDGTENKHLPSTETAQKAKRKDLYIAGAHVGARPPKFEIAVLVDIAVCPATEQLPLCLVATLTTSTDQSMAKTTFW